MRARPGGIDAGGRAFTFPSKVIVGSDQGEAHAALVSPLLQRLLEGYSCTLLAGSGKTVKDVHHVRPVRIPHRGQRGTGWRPSSSSVGGLPADCVAVA